MILYKYYPCNEYTFRALSELGMWCSPASNMNDPFDCLTQLDINIEQPEIERLRSYIQVQAENENKAYLFDNLYFLNDKEITDLIANARKDLIKNLTFCSLTENPFNNLMWAHYGKSHQGIVLGIDIDDRIINNGLICHKIIYQNTLPDFDPMSVLVILASTASILEQTTIVELEAIKAYYRLLSVKTIDRVYEKEWRLWYKKKQQYFNYKPESLKSVYFGLQCPQETKTLVKSILRGHGVSDDVYRDIKIETDPEIRLTI